MDTVNIFISRNREKTADIMASSKGLFGCGERGAGMKRQSKLT